jgi:hypothetical protein
LVHAVQDVALVVLLNVPLAHALHVLSVVVVPAVLTYVPAIHEVQAPHTVALSPSWSQVPTAHGTFGAVFPAQ